MPRLVQQLDWLIGNCTANKSCSWVPNLTGFIVGNGVTDYRYDNGLQLLEMIFWYGLVSTDDYEYTKTYCLSDNPPAKCNQTIAALQAAIANINIYDAFGKCWN